MLVVKTEHFCRFAIPPASRFELDECCGGRSNLFIALVISYLDNTSLATRPHEDLRWMNVSAGEAISHGLKSRDGFGTHHHVVASSKGASPWQQEGIKKFHFPDISKGWYYHLLGFVLKTRSLQNTPLRAHFNFSHGIEIPRGNMWPSRWLGHETTRAIGSVAYCFNGFQSVVHFRLRKIEIHPIEY